MLGKTRTLVRAVTRLKATPIETGAIGKGKPIAEERVRQQWPFGNPSLEVCHPFREELWQRFGQVAIQLSAEGLR